MYTFVTLMLNIYIYTGKERRKVLVGTGARVCTSSRKGRWKVLVDTSTTI